MRLLDGVHVLELGGFISGPYAGQLLAEMGADVVKLEPPDGGDPFRSFGGRDYSPQFCAYNKHKRSVAVDLGCEAGQAVVRRLAARADVMLDNFRPGVLDRLGLDDAGLVAANPRLIRASLTGFGATGPYARRPAYDTVAMAYGGLLSQLLAQDRPEIIGPAMADAISGLYTALGILGALFERERSGVGRRVEVAMTEAVAAFATEPFSTYLQTGRIPGPRDRAAVSQSYALPCADGRLIGLHLSSPPKFWTGLLTAISRPDLGADPRFADRAGRVEHYAALSDALATVFRARPLSEWLPLLAAQDVPHAPVLNLADAVDDAQARHLGTFLELDHPVAGPVRSVTRPVMIDGGRDPGTPPPLLGEHTRAALFAAGYAPAEIVALENAGVVACD